MHRSAFGRQCGTRLRRPSAYTCNRWTDISRHWLGGRSRPVSQSWEYEDFRELDCHWQNNWILYKRESDRALHRPRKSGRPGKRLRRSQRRLRQSESAYTPQLDQARHCCVAHLIYHDEEGKFNSRYKKEFSLPSPLVDESLQMSDSEDPAVSIPPRDHTVAKLQFSRFPHWDGGSKQKSLGMDHVCKCTTSPAHHRYSGIAVCHTYYVLH